MSKIGRENKKNTKHLEFIKKILARGFWKLFAFSYKWFKDVRFRSLNSLTIQKSNSQGPGHPETTLFGKKSPPLKPSDWRFSSQNIFYWNIRASNRVFRLGSELLRQHDDCRCRILGDMQSFGMMAKNVVIFFILDFWST